MVHVPFAVPLTVPIEFTSAIAVLSLDQEPPVVADDSVVVAPIQTEATPVMVDGRPFTVAIVVEIAVPQVRLIEYDKATVPIDMALITPVTESMVAIIGFADTQVPPNTVDVAVSTLPTQILTGEIVPAVALEVTVTM